MKNNSTVNINKLKLELKKGSTVALQKLHKRYAGKLYYFINAYTHNTQVTEELVQDVFIRLWYNRKNLKSTLSLQSYIYTIAKNLSIDFLRKQVNTPLHLDNINRNKLTSYNNAETEIISIEEKAVIDNAIENLSSRKKEVFRMHRFEKKTYKVIAEELQISVSAVEKNISSALSELRFKLTEKNIS